jgi:putative AlgH/UPF0301 family transcriptional regulator
VGSRLSGEGGIILASDAKRLVFSDNKIFWGGPVKNSQGVVVWCLAYERNVASKGKSLVSREVSMVEAGSGILSTNLIMIWSKN